MESASSSTENPTTSSTTGGTFPGTSARVVLLSVAALVAGIAGSMWLESVRYEEFTGFLQARVHAVTSGRDARIVRVLVAEGSVVTAGQPLVILNDERLLERITAQNQTIESLEIELVQAEARLEVELDWRRKDLLERIFEARLKSAELVRKQVQPSIETPVRKEFALRSEPRTTPVVQATHESSTVFPDRSSREKTRRAANAPEAARPAEGSLIAELQLCSDHVAELERMNRELPEKISRSMGVNLARTRLEHARAELCALVARQRELTVVAPEAGMIGVFHKEAGDHVRATEPIVQILDEDKPFLMLQIPSPRIADFAPGTIVDLRFPGGIIGKGRVDEIPPQTSPIPADGKSPSGTIITAHVEPLGTLWPDLPFGSVVEVRRKR